MSNENNYPMVKMQDIYDSIIEHYKWQNYSEAKVRLLRMKYATLQSKLVLCDRKDFKKSGKNYIPAVDAPIVQAVLIEAVDDADDNPIYKWFNGDLDTEVAEYATVLFMCFKSVITQACYEAGLDRVTLDEWLNTVSASINHSTAENTWRLKRNLEAFRNNSLALDCTVPVGDIIATGETGERGYALRSQKAVIDIRGKTIEDIMDAIETQDDYFSVFSQLLSMFNEHAKASVLAKIEAFAEIKETCNLDKADDCLDHVSIASEYIIWYQRIHDFLVANPEVCATIEQKTNSTGLAEFFRMSDR